MTNKKILITDNVNEKAAAYLKGKGFEVTTVPTQDPGVLAGLLPGYHGIIVRSATKLRKELLETLPDLKIIGRAGAGLDNIDVAFAKDKGIEIVNSPMAHAVSVAEHAMALMLSITRNIPKADAAMKAGKWIKKQLKSNEVRGKVLGIIGFGNIGQQVARRALAFGMKVYTYDVVPACNEISEEMGCTVSEEINEMLPFIDYLTLHVPHNKHTHHLLDAKRISLLKVGAILINTSRGKVIDQDALVDALQQGTIRGAALDVFKEEPIPQGDPILELDNVILTPHIASATVETQELAATTVAEEIANFFA